MSYLNTPCRSNAGIGISSSGGGTVHEEGMRDGAVAIDVCDASNSYSHATARRPAHARLPHEDAEGDACGVLVTPMYGGDCGRCGHAGAQQLSHDTLVLAPAR